tara:strand:- start:12171 stop:13889 length:1719 start_codon:yes stop_codon:yes gene_type:complete
MKNLTEQLDRIKNLMVYEKGSPINEVSTKTVKTTTKSTSSSVSKNKEATSTIMSALSKEENCVVVTNTENFNVNITVGEGAKKFHDKFINSLKEKFGKDLSGGHLVLSDVKVFGGASNNNGGKVKPEWCNEYDEKSGTKSLKKWSSGCVGFGDVEYKGNSAGTGRNTKLALNRAKNVLKQLKTYIINSAKESNVKLPDGFNESEIEYESGTVYTGNKIDKSKPNDLNNGQIVMIDAKLCFVKDPEPEPKECSDKCMEKDANGKCVCPESKGLKEVDGKCVCIKDNKPPNENCECKEKPKECPTCQELNEETKKCGCQKGLKEEKDDEGKIKCVCPNEGEELIKSGKKCECKKQPKPPACNESYEVKGGRGTKPNNFVTKTLQRKWPFEGTGEVTISFNPLVVPDGFYVKYGKQEFWSGFVGDVYKTGDGLYKMMSVPKNQKERFYKDIFPSNLTQENDTSIVDGFPRNFAAELVWYKQNDGLLDSINAEINKVGGTSVNNIFKNGDSQAEKVTNGIKNTKTPLRDIYDSYGNVLKGDTKFTLKKESGEEENIIIIVFSPLAETLFNMKIECK